MPTIITVFVDPQTHLHNWTYTKKQEQEGHTQLKRIISSYPTPKYFKGVIKGSILRIGNKWNETYIKEKLSHFFRSISHPKKADFDESVIRRIGDLPLQEIHDPFLKRKVKNIWTLDVSYNPALSIKDIMARQMVNDALREKKIVLGKTHIVEATSGNTGAGLALLGAFYGLSVLLTVPDKVSAEKINRLRELGAHVIVTPTNVAPGDPKSYYSVRDFLGRMKDVWIPQQYDNPSNTVAHRLYTGPHIWEATKGTITAVIAPTGTGGTISGIGQYLKSKNPKVKIIGVDPIGSVLYLLKNGHKLQDVQKYAHAYDIQGFGEDFLPKNVDLYVIDEFIRISDISGLQMTRLLPTLGFFQGQSSGASYAALLEAIDKKIVGKNDSVFVIFPDVGIPYRNDVYNDDWMKAKKFSFNY